MAVKFSAAFPEGHKNLEIIELVGDNFNIAWGRVKGQKFAHRKDAKNAEKIKEKD